MVRFTEGETLLAIIGSDDGFVLPVNGERGATSTLEFRKGACSSKIHGILATDHSYVSEVMVNQVRKLLSKQSTLKITPGGSFMTMKSHLQGCDTLSASARRRVVQRLRRVGVRGVAPNGH